MFSILANGTYRGLAERLGLHPETLRRYIINGPPSVEFYQAIHREGYSIDWIVGGTYEARIADHPRPLSDVPIEELFAEIGRRHEGLNARITALTDGIQRLQEVDHTRSPVRMVVPRIALLEAKEPVQEETSLPIVIGQIGVEPAVRSERR